MDTVNEPAQPPEKTHYPDCRETICSPGLAIIETGTWAGADIWRSARLFACSWILDDPAWSGAAVGRFRIGAAVSQKNRNISAQVVAQALTPLGAFWTGG